jgi:NADP-dependent 3-hydroxy acid dehydrogenase YdfG
MTGSRPATALVTGAASGIGAATARLLAREGADVLLCDIDDDRGSRLARELGAAYQHLDVRDADAWLALSVEPDFLVLNAGVVSGPSRVSVDDLTGETWRRLRNVNIDGTVNGILRFAGSMADRGHGSIVVTSSLAGLVGYPGDPLYAATKHFAVGLVRSLAGLLQASDVTINAVCPDATRTEILTGDQKEGWHDLLLDADTVAATVMHVLRQPVTGEAWFVVKGREPQPYRFGGVPAARKPH